jgi:hypothetical protein
MMFVCFDWVDIGVVDMKFIVVLRSTRRPPT